MNTGKAVAIFKNIGGKDYSDEEKGTAILTVLRMATINSVTKTDMINVIDYLWDMVFVEREEYESGDTFTVIK